MPIELTYELQGDAVQLQADFNFDYYYDPESEEELFFLTYYFDFNNGQYRQTGYLYGPGSESFVFAADVDGQTRVEVGAEESWTWAHDVVVKNLIIALNSGADQAVAGTAGDDVLFSGDFRDDVVLGDGNDWASLGDGDDIVAAGAGSDYIDGGRGADIMIGGPGDDRYVVDNVGDRVIERANEGYDTVHSSISYTLGDHVDALQLLGSGNLTGEGNKLANVITGNAGNNILRGFAGNDTLIGLGGADRLEGGKGNDLYIIDANDKIVELPDEGIDTVRVAFNYSLANRPNLENITLFGTNHINATGNDARNILIGNSGHNVLDGRGGADRMTGGFGNDTYRVDNVGDRVIETSTLSWEIDRVLSSVDFKLGRNVEELFLTGTDDISATGNSLDNTIRGNSGNNLIEAGAGNDRVVGGAGDDTMRGGRGEDRFVFGDGDGNDTILDFQNGFDRIDLKNVSGVASFADLVLTDTGDGVLVDYGTGTVHLASVKNFALIGAEDFVFA